MNLIVVDTVWCMIIMTIMTVMTVMTIIDGEIVGMTVSTPIVKILIALYLLWMDCWYDIDLCLVG